MIFLPFSFDYCFWILGDGWNGAMEVLSMHGREPAHRAREAVWRGFCGRPQVRLNLKTLLDSAGLVGTMKDGQIEFLGWVVMKDGLNKHVESEL